MTDNIYLPSGLSISVAKKDARGLKKQNPNLTHIQALDIICKKNGYDRGWNEFMASVLAVPTYSGSDNPHRNLLVTAINYILQKGLVSLNAPNDYHNKKAGLGRRKEEGHTITQIDGRETAINWIDIGHEEIRISVWWDYDHSKHPQANSQGNSKERFHCSSPLAKKSRFKDFVGVTCSGWIERQEGKYLQGSGKDKLFGVYTRKENLEPLMAIKKAIPIGFKSEGYFHR